MRGTRIGRSSTPSTNPYSPGYWPVRTHSVESLVPGSTLEAKADWLRKHKIRLEGVAAEIDDQEAERRSIDKAAADAAVAAAREAIFERLDATTSPFGVCANLSRRTRPHSQGRIPRSRECTAEAPARTLRGQMMYWTSLQRTATTTKRRRRVRSCASSTTRKPPSASPRSRRSETPTRAAASSWTRWSRRSSHSAESSRRW